MNDYRQVKLYGKFHLMAESLDLLGKEISAPIEVQTYLADTIKSLYTCGWCGEILPYSCQLRTPIFVLVYRGGVESHKGHEVVAVGATQLEQSLVALDIYRREYDALHTLQVGTLDNLCSVLVESLIVDM